MEGQIRGGHPEIEGLCLALFDWNVELGLIEMQANIETFRF
jgi:hypothetical protein